MKGSKGVISASEIKKSSNQSWRSVGWRETHAAKSGSNGENKYHSNMQIMAINKKSGINENNVK